MIVWFESHNWKWESAERKEFQVVYTNKDNKQCKHWPDFLVGKRWLIECKPKNLHNDPNVLLKSAAMLAWCEANGYEYSIIAPKRLEKEELRKMFKEGVIKMQSTRKFKRHIK